MNKNIYQLTYDRENVTADELEELYQMLSRIFSKDDIVIIIPSVYNLKEISLDELIRIRDLISNTIDEIIRNEDDLK